MDLGTLIKTEEGAGEGTPATAPSPLRNIASADELRGTYTALITPMKDDSGMIDYAKTKKLVDDQIYNNIDGIVLVGTTGQSPSFTHDGQIDFISKVSDYINGRTKLIAGAGANNTSEAVYLTKGIQDKIGPTTFLSVVPYYNKPTQKGIITHFSKIADSLDEESNLILYNVPSRTGKNMEAETTIELAYNPKIIGIKEASGNLDQVKEIIDGTKELDFNVLSGEDHLVTDIIKIGGTGVISASANIAPKIFNELVHYGLKGDHETSKLLQEYINPLVKECVFYESNPIPLAHIFNTHIKLPLLKEDRIEKQVMSVLSRKEYSAENLGIDWRNYRD